MKRCTKCNHPIQITAQDRKRIRMFLSRYPWVSQKHLGELMNISQSRISEIVRADIMKGGA